DPPALLILRPQQSSGEPSRRFARSTQFIDSGAEEKDGNCHSEKKDLQRQDPHCGIDAGEHGGLVKVLPNGNHGYNEDRSVRAALAETDRRPKYQRKRRVEKRRQKSASRGARTHLKHKRARDDKTQNEHKGLSPAARRGGIVRMRCEPV